MSLLDQRASLYQASQHNQVIVVVYAEYSLLESHYAVAAIAAMSVTGFTPPGSCCLLTQHSFCSNISKSRFNTIPAANESVRLPSGMPPSIPGKQNTNAQLHSSTSPLPQPRYPSLLHTVYHTARMNLG